MPPLGRARATRPRRRCTAKQRDELAPFQLIELPAAPAGHFCMSWAK
jgi:hypothetical protein